MIDGLPDWLRASAADSQADGTTGGAGHLAVLRRLLEREYLTRADWDWALPDVARMACDALEASATRVALWFPAQGGWTAVTSEGQRLDTEAISAHASRSVLERVGTLDQPVLTTSAVPLDVDAESVRRLDVESVLAVPLYFWDV